MLINRTLSVVAIDIETGVCRKDEGVSEKPKRSACRTTCMSSFSRIATKRTITDESVPDSSQRERHTYHRIRNSSVLDNPVDIDRSLDCPLGDDRHLRCSKRNSSMDLSADRMRHLRSLDGSRIGRMHLRWHKYRSCMTREHMRLHGTREREKRRKRR